MTFATIQPYLYPIALLVISLAVAVAEALWPWRPAQKQWRSFLWSDVLHLVFNGHFLGVFLFVLASKTVLPVLDGFLDEAGLTSVLYRGVAAEWPIVLQIVVALFVVDFLQWVVHNLLHRVPFLWDFHKVHHSIVDGEMDWIVSFRFQWTEVVVYKSLLYLPLAYFGFGYEAVMTHAIFGTLIGHLNHANLNISWGPLRYLLNSPAMHIWHHDYNGTSKSTVNFGIIFSCWDWIFRTAKMPGKPPAKLGYAGVETLPRNFFAHMGWPLVGRSATSVATAGGVALLITTAYITYKPAAPPDTPMLGEVAASSQPASSIDFPYPETPQQADAGLNTFGRAARHGGFAHPDAMVSVDELAAALGATRLKLIDVRPAARFAQGHIPSAMRLDRAHYSVTTPVPGVTRSSTQLRALLDALGIENGDVVVVYADGGPEPYRLWWSLRTALGRDVRVLDGGLDAWKARGHGLAEGASSPLPVPADTEGDDGSASNAPVRVAAEGAQILDTRSRDEFTGRRLHKKSQRAGHMPGAKHYEWTRVFEAEGPPRLKAPEALRAEFASLALDDKAPVVTMCQSGTRSSAVYFALWQSGWPTARLSNDDGSWAAYSRSALPLCDCDDVAPTDPQ